MDPPVLMLDFKLFRLISQARWPTEILKKKRVEGLKGGRVKGLGKGAFFCLFSELINSLTLELFNFFDS
jgi:hypothetical protein